ncbi:hypothetical protein JOQ06_014807 [Pogonophryne albipinna]|uniref:Uncharacterized protein n=1 Tax=Pogonophryne albipinna TaxID=1090488 RepID=A0AAD6ALV5_9TELE|nr:hypothetical protein JOQ06_014807 [Pogonophryne albipinna]
MILLLIALTLVTGEADLRGALLGLGGGGGLLQLMTGAVSGQGGGAAASGEQDLLRGHIWRSRQSESRAAYPPGLGSAELTERGTAFGRIVHFNRSVFSRFYAPILRKLLVPPGRGQDQGGSRQAEGDPDPPPW